MNKLRNYSIPSPTIEFGSLCPISIDNLDFSPPAFHGEQFVSFCSGYYLFVLFHLLNFMSSSVTALRPDARRRFGLDPLGFDRRQVIHVAVGGDQAQLDQPNSGDLRSHRFDKCSESGLAQLTGSHGRMATGGFVAFLNVIPKRNVKEANWSGVRRSYFVHT
jgi:hypothetical protein